MKTLIALMLLVLATGCTKHTPNGDCVGVLSEEGKKSGYEYSG